MRVPTAQHPATWLTVADLVPGDLVVSRTQDLRVITRPVTGLVPVRGRRTQVLVGDRVYYPRATASTPVLVLR